MADQIKEAFSKVKEDIMSLNEQLKRINLDLINIKESVFSIKTQTIRQTDRQTNQQNIQTDRQTNRTNNSYEEKTFPLESLKDPNIDFSTGNEGVQTDRQTDNQTDRQTEKFAQYTKPIRAFDFKNIQEHLHQDKISQINKVTEILDTLDELRKDIRQKFKKLTNQEMAIFSLIYNLEESNTIVDYPLISSKLSITESAVRDHVRNIISKGIPLLKTKENNKKVSLSISSDLKKVASIQTILSLRNL